MTALTPPAHRRLSAVFEILVRWYPAAFRVQFKQEMLATFQDWLNAEPAPLSKVQHLRIAGSLVADMLPAIIHEHVFLWRNSMKVSSIFQIVAITLLAAWAVIWAWFIGSWFMLLPFADPARWLLGEDYTSTANSIFGAALFIIPFLALLTFVIPALKVQTTSENGDSILMVRLQKMGKFQALVTWVCLAVTVVLWGMVFVSRMGWL